MVIVLTSLIVSSQTVTGQDSFIRISKSLATSIAKDLVRKDSLESEILVVKRNESLLISNLSAKDSIVEIKNQQLALSKSEVTNLNTIIKDKDTEKKNLELTVTQLNKDLRKTKRKLAFTKVGSAIIILFLGYLIVK